MWDLVEPEDIWQGAPVLRVTHYTEHASFMPESCGASYIATLGTVGYGDLVTTLMGRKVQRAKRSPTQLLTPTSGSRTRSRSHISVSQAESFGTMALIRVICG